MHTKNSLEQNDKLKDKILKKLASLYNTQDIMSYYKNNILNIDERFEGIEKEQIAEFIDKYIQIEDFSYQDIINIHKFLYAKIDSKNAGKLRDKAAFLSTIFLVFTVPDKIKSELDSMFFNMKTNRAKMHPIEFAALAHINLVFIHPFVDGNGRVARLLTNLILIKNGFCPINIAQNRQKYYDTLHDFWSGNKISFINLVQELVLKQQEELLNNL